MKLQNIVLVAMSVLGALVSADMSKSICMSNGYQYGIAPKALDGIASAEMICYYAGGHLATFHNNNEFSVLKALAMQTNYDYVYLGLVDHDGDNLDYAWLNGSPNEYVLKEKSYPWYYTEPNGQYQYCTVMFKKYNYLIGDHYCNRGNFAVACIFECT